MTDSQDILGDAEQSVGEIERQCRYLRGLISQAGGPTPPDPGPEPPSPPVEPPAPLPGGLQVGYWNEGNPANTHGDPLALSMSRHPTSTEGAGRMEIYYARQDGLWQPDRLKRHAAESKAEGAIGIVWDLEIDPALEEGPQWFARAAEAIRSELPLWIAPKAPLDHFYSYKGRTTWGWTAAKVVPLFAQTCDGAVPWHYATPAVTWDNGILEGIWYRNGWPRAKPIMCLGEPLRTWDGNHPWGVADINYFHSEGISYGFFAPVSWRGRVIDYSGSVAMRRSRELHR